MARNVNVKGKNKRMKIKLNNKFYDKETVKEALKAFEDVCKGNIIDDAIEVELEADDKLKDEFCNYVLGLMKNKNLV